VTDDVAIVTSRLRLRLLAPQDEALYVALYTDADVMRHIAPPLSTSDAQASFAVALKRTHTKPAKQLFFAIERRADQQTIGICGMMQLDAQKQRAEVGIMLLPSANGAGLATDALGALLHHLFVSIDVEEIWVEHARDCERVRNLNDRLGFTRRPLLTPQGEATDKCIGAVFRKEWLSSYSTPYRGKTYV
jgi:[ribosomal protein S5]-alanine N-acetyltransferase